MLSIIFFFSFFLLKKIRVALESRTVIWVAFLLTITVKMLHQTITDGRQMNMQIRLLLYYSLSFDLSVIDTK